MRKLNDYFSHIYCINLTSRPDRRSQFTQEASEVGFDFQFVDGVVCESNGRLRASNLGNNHAHCGIVKLAKERGYEKVLIFEDDCIFRRELLEYMYEGLNNLPSFDMLYLGGSYIYGEPIRELDDKYFNRAWNLFTNHAYCLSSTIYDRFLELMSEENMEIDNYTAILQKECNALVFKRNVCIQRNGYSDICQMDVNYEEYMLN